VTSLIDATNNRVHQRRIPEGYAANLAGLLQGLKESGYIDRQNVGIEYCWAKGHYDRLPTILAELVMSGNRPCCDEHSCGPRCKGWNHDDPMFVTDGDPVGLGLVSNMSRPGG